MEKNPNTKVVDLRKLRNFVVDKFLIWIRLVPLKNDLHSVLYSMSRTKTAYGRIWVCGVVVEEASCEVEVTGLNHGNGGASRLYGWVAGQWGLSYKKVFSVYFRFLRADAENLSASGWLKRPPALGLYAGGRTTANTETICAGTRSLAGAPPASKDPFYPPAQIVCGLVAAAVLRILLQQ
jgi:hypothetical protein